uniref:Uncharacterized protein n=1 Tax=Oryza glumipatula TaxID=40148 RepID=A0A0E0BAL1_9ORYZ
MVHTGRRRWLPSPSLADLAGGGRREAGGGGGGGNNNGAGQRRRLPSPSLPDPAGGRLGWVRRTGGEVLFSPEIGGRTRKAMNGNGSAKEGGK